MKDGEPREESKRSTKPASQPATDAEQQTSASESNTVSPQNTMFQLPPAQESPFPEPATQPSPTPAPSVDTSGLVLVDRAWMEAVEIQMKTTSEMLQRMQGQNVSPNGQPPNGQTLQNGKPKSWVEGLIEVGLKILDKLPPMQGGPSPLEQTFAQRYMNLLDTAYGRYIPPITPPNQLPAQVPPSGS